MARKAARRQRQVSEDNPDCNSDTAAGAGKRRNRVPESVRGAKATRAADGQVLATGKGKSKGNGHPAGKSKTAPSASTKARGTLPVRTTKKAALGKRLQLKRSGCLFVGSRARYLYIVAPENDPFLAVARDCYLKKDHTQTREFPTLRQAKEWCRNHVELYGSDTTGWTGMEQAKRARAPADHGDRVLPPLRRDTADLP